MSPGKALILVGIALVVVGVYFSFGGKLGFLGRLPGDLRIERPGFTFYFPLTSSALASLLISLVLWLFRR